MVHARRPAAATQLDVEKMILDFLLYMANCAVLEDYNAHAADSSAVVGQKSLQHLQTVHSFGAIFKKHFSSERMEAGTSFRLRLLKFSVLLSRRTIPGITADFSPILDSLRTSYGRRTTYFVSSHSTCPLHRGYLQQLPIGVEYRRHYVEILRENGATEIRPPLIELQSIFFKLSAYRGVLGSDSSLRRDWMTLAGQFMLQSAIEQLLIYSTKDAEVLQDAFSWTWKADRNAEQILTDQGDEEMAQWEHIRNCWAAALNPQSASTSLSRHLLSVAKQYPLHQFEAQLMAFINRLHHALSPPLLSQIDDGCVDGMSSEQFKDLIRRAQVVC